MRIIGIDPGAGGGIAVKDKNTPTKVYKMPKGMSEMRTFFKELQTGNDVIFLEKVMMMRKDLLEGGKAFGIAKMTKAYNEMKTILFMLDYLVYEVYPISWQSYLQLRVKGEKDKQARKNRYKSIAQKHYPEVKVVLWNSDALLILHYGRKQMQYELRWLQQQAAKTNQIDKFIKLSGND